MDAVVVYESVWGNTKAVAEAVADGLGEHTPVRLMDVGTAPPAHELDARMIVVGGPTHAFGMSRAATREDAHKRGGAMVDTGIREWIESASGLQCLAATFDTHVRHPNLPGSAAHKAARKLRRLGATLVVEPESFWVEGSDTPRLLPGELERAREWGAQLADMLPAVSRAR